MDVLQFIKAELREQTRHLQAAQATQLKLPELRRLLAYVKAYVQLESEYLLPELSAVAPQDPLIAKMSHDLGILHSRLEACEEAVERVAIAPLNEAFMQHAQWVEDRILPFVRQKISTAEREELYHVLLDAKQDLEPASSLVLAI